jgi:hypothetical protein
VAQEKRAVIEATAREVDALVLLSEVLNHYFAKKPLDDPFNDEELVEFSFQGLRDRVVRHSGKKNPTVRDFIRVSGPRHRERAHDVLCPQQVADQMEEWFSAPACDGFVLEASHMPGAYDTRCGCWCRSCNAVICSKRNMLARHCATIWAYRSPAPPIGTRRTGGLRRFAISLLRATRIRRHQ